MPGLVPHFAGAGDTDALPAVPSLSKWLGRARTGDGLRGDMESAVVSALFPNEGRTPALAACSYVHDFGTAPDRYCLRADPVHLQADTHGLVMLDCSLLELNQPDSQALAKTVREHLAEDGWQLQVGDSCRWYLLGEDQDLQTPPPGVARMRHVSLSALRGKDARHWMCRLNEVQMLLNGSEINSQRTERRQKPINSLHLWGGGRLGSATSAKLDYLVSGDNAVVQGAAASAGLRLLKAKQATEILQQSGDSLKILVTLEACRDAEVAGDSMGWIQALQQLESQWLDPLLTAWHRRQVDRLELHPLNGRVYRLDPSLRWQFWRRPRDYRTLPDFGRVTRP